MRDVKDKKVKVPPSSSIRYQSAGYVLIIVSLLYYVYYRYFTLHALPKPLPKSIAESVVNNYHNSSIKTINNVIQIPKVIHQMWKDNYDTIPYDLKRWRAGCVKK